MTVEFLLVFKAQAEWSNHTGLLRDRTHHRDWDQHNRKQWGPGLCVMWNVLYNLIQPIFSGPRFRSRSKPVWLNHYRGTFKKHMCILCFCFIIIVFLLFFLAEIFRKCFLVLVWQKCFFFCWASYFFRKTPLFWRFWPQRSKILFKVLFCTNFLKKNFGLTSLDIKFPPTYTTYCPYISLNMIKIYRNND